MEWIRFLCLDLKPFQQIADRILTKLMLHKINYGNGWRENSLRASLPGRMSDGTGVASGFCRGTPLAGWLSPTAEYSGTISFILSRMASVAIAIIDAFS
jgi:hypothetical protein